MGHHIHAVVTVELEFDVVDESWLFSRMAQEVQELVDGTDRRTVKNVTQKLLHMSIDNIPLEES